MVKSALPLSYNGQIVDGFSLTSKNGKVKAFSAEKGYDTLKHLLDTDEPRFCGQGRIRPGAVYAPALVLDEARREWIQQIRLCLPSRTAVVLRRV